MPSRHQSALRRFFVNISDMVGLGHGLLRGSGKVTRTQPLEFLIQTRFVPIFTFPFGMRHSQEKRFQQPDVGGLSL